MLVTCLPFADEAIGHLMVNPLSRILATRGSMKYILMNVDGSNAHIISPAGGNAQGAAFSPDGQWVTFTAYYDHPGEDNGCEIYIMRVDGTDLRRLTDNDYCDYQPRWGQ